MKPNSKFSTVFIKAILVFLFVLLSFLFIRSLCNINDLAIRFYWNVTHKPLVLILFSVALMLFIFAIFKLINKCNDKKLTIITIAIFAVIVIGQAFFAFKFDFHFITDSFMVNDQALAIAKGFHNYIDTNNSYFYYISNNNFIVLFLAVIYKILVAFGITDYVSVLSFFNAILIDVSIFLIYKTIRLCFNKTVATKYMVLSLLNPMNYFIIYWVYTATFSMPLTAAVVYLSVSIWKSRGNNDIKNYIKIGLIALIAVVGFFMRPTVLIPLIAAALCFILFIKIRKKNFKQVGISVLVFIVVGVISYASINKVVYSFVPDKSGYFPITHYIVLGLSNDGKYSDDIVRDTIKYKTNEERRNYHIKQIQKILKERGFTGITKLYLNKAEATWTEDSGAYVGLTKAVENEGTLYNHVFGDKCDYVSVYCQIFRILTLLFAAIMALFQLIRKKYDINILISVTILGAIVFYMIWEAKAVYSVPFIPILLMMTCFGMENTSTLANKRHAISKITVIPILCIIEIATLIFGFTYFYDFAQKDVNSYDMAMFSYGSNWQYYLKDAASKNKIVKQDFYTKTHFNTLEFKAKPLSKQNSQYQITLQSNGKVLFEKVVDPTTLQNESLAFPVGSQQPKGLQKYTVTIKPLSNKNSLGFYIDQYDAMKKYDGDLYINSDKQKGNLLIKAYYKYESIGIKPYLYWGIIIFIMLLEIGSAIIILWPNKKE